ncbi:peptidoglycan-binding protein [Paracoccus sp. (in: a-proteobacteria)]|uniref:peptidoglycan-binding protein n=1 Tax=Paracoccus sp. TaxID=267 RepID=UPI0035B0CFC3
MRLAFALTASLIGVLPAGAENRAVVIGNSDYQTAPDLAGADMRAAVEALAAAGFQTGDGTDLDAAALRGHLRILTADAPQPGSRIVVLNGRFVHDSGETWFLGSDAQSPDPFNAGLQGVPLSLVLRLISEGRPGAVLMLGTDGQQMPHQPGLDSGIGGLTPPQGVAVITGTPEAIARGMAELLRGSSVAQTVAADQALQLLPGSPGRMVPVPRGMTGGVTGNNAGDPLRADREAWAAAAAANTVPAYISYLRRFPSGQYAATARARLEDGPATHPPSAEPRNHRPGAPTPPGAEAERAMAITNAERATIQRWLSRLGHDAGTADAVFGQRTRSALAAWQKANGHPPTGYLSSDQRRMIRAQIDHLDGDNGSRDRAYWQLTGARGDAEGLRAYLRRYPNGLHAASARQTLDAATGNVTPNLPQGDAATWRWAREQGSAASYETYLERYPQGANAAEARTHLLTMRAATEAARREERGLGLDIAALRLIEERLRIAGMRPGPVDGEFTDQTRAALRRYQGARNLRVTGFVTQETVTSLMADVVLR